MAEVSSDELPVAPATPADAAESFVAVVVDAVVLEAVVLDASTVLDVDVATLLDGTMTLSAATSRAPQPTSPAARSSRAMPDTILEHVCIFYSLPAD